MNPKQIIQNKFKKLQASDSESFGDFSNDDQDQYSNRKNVRSDIKTEDIRVADSNTDVRTETSNVSELRKQESLESNQDSLLLAKKANGSGTVNSKYVRVRNTTYNTSKLTSANKASVSIDSASTEDSAEFAGDTARNDVSMSDFLKGNR
jgi:hypothetical protein